MSIGEGYFDQIGTSKDKQVSLISHICFYFILTPSRHPVAGKTKSFDDQVLDLIALNKLFPKDSFTGKCQIIISKINQAGVLLQQWDKERKPLLKQNPLKLLIEAILVLGQSIAYYGMLKLEPIMNQYFEFIENHAKTNKPPKTRAVSAFFLGGLTPISVSGGNGNANGSATSASSLNSTYSSAQQMKIIKGFIAMLRHNYREASDLFNEAEDENLDYYSHVLILKYICQSNDQQLHRRELEILGDKIMQTPFVSSFKFHTLAKIYERLYVLEQMNLSRHKRRSILRNSTHPNYHDILMRFYLSAAAYAQDDDLYITQYYDNILNFLIGASEKRGDNDDSHDKVRILTLSFFYQVRNYFCLRSDYNYLYIPNLVGDWQVIKANSKLKLQIERFLDPDIVETSLMTGPSPASAHNHKRSIKLFDMIGFWEKEYVKFKGEIPDTIKQYLQKK